MTGTTIRRFLSHEPISEEPPSISKRLDVKNQKYYQLLNSEVRKKLKNVIFLIGPWGSGKTATLRTLEGDEKDLRIKFRNFFGVQSANEAMSHLIGIGWRILIFILATVLFYEAHFLAQEYLLVGLDFDKDLLLKGFLGTLLVFLFTFVVTPKSRLLFFLALLPKAICTHLTACVSGKINVLVIEDLDRSSMDISERFSFLSQLPPMLGTYVVAYGYSSDEEHAALIEYISKMGGTPINLNQDMSLTFEILRSNATYHPFRNAAKWMSSVSLRAHLSIYSKTERENDGSCDFEKKLAFLNSYVEYIRTSVVSYEPGRDGSDLSLSFDGGNFSISPGIKYTRREAEFVNSFVKNIDSEYFRLQLEKGVSKGEEKSRASNWVDVAWHKLQRDQTYMQEFVARLNSTT